MEQRALEAKYGRWTVLRVEVPGSRGKLACRCDCGTEKAVQTNHLLSGASQSCGCRTAERARTHGGSKTPTYGTWEQMMQRCYNANAKAFRNYGWRGISVCDRWLGSDGFSNFLADMGERPDGLTIERKDTNGNYEPGNCRWATRTEQNRNTRRNKFLTWQGETLTQSAWAERLGIGVKTIEGRLFRGWSVERALSAVIDPKAGGWAVRR